MDHLRLFPYTRMLYAFLGQGGRHLREAQDLPLWFGMVRRHNTRQSIHPERDRL
jgi:hypothetical protein